MLEAASVLRGNLLLTGWTVSNISFVTTDLPFYIVGVAIKGLNPSLLRDVPSVVYAVAVGTAVVLAALGRRSATLAAATVIVLLALPAGGLAEFVTKGYTRVGTSLGLFAGLIALEGPVTQRVSIKRLGLYALAMALTLLSDTFTMVIAVIAVLIVWHARGRSRGDIRRSRPDPRRRRDGCGGHIGSGRERGHRRAGGL